MKTEQSTLFITIPEKKAHDCQRAIMSLVRKLKSGELRPPIFQRSSVWTKNQKREWIVSLANGEPIGVVVTYQEAGGGPIFLLDGYQRLLTTMKALLPTSNISPFGEEQTRIYIENFEISVQHRIYKTHRDAMYAFQNLDKGTPLTPSEHYKGELCLDNDLGQIVYDKIPEIVSSVCKSLLTGRNEGPKKESSRIRNSFALFLQYISDTKTMTFWSCAERSKNQRNPVEKVLGDYLLNEIKNEEKLQEYITYFERHLFKEVVAIEKIIEETGQKGKRASDTFIRWLLHVATWRKNLKISVDLYTEFITRFISFYDDYVSFGARLEIIVNRNGEDKKQPIAITMGNINGLKRLSRFFGMDLENDRKRKSNSGAAPGYNVSHIKPVSLHGEGETVFETALSNQSRGAREMVAVAADD